MASRPKGKLWSDVSMSAAVTSVFNGEQCLREAACLYNVLVETLRRHVSGSVDLNCKPGPATVLSEEEESKLAIYLVQMTIWVLYSLKKGL